MVESVSEEEFRELLKKPHNKQFAQALLRAENK
jgi:hypothetical protein